ncbi:MAG: 3'(2'),5'-bisphosphate nucleotidase CysQ [Gammaproteobacteria bacterium]
MRSELLKFQPELINIAQRASEAILRLFKNRQMLTIQTKEDQSPVTAADLAASQILTEGLQQLTPEIPVISEESQAPTWEERQKWPAYWLLDPLDGTKQFIQGHDQFVINIALIENHRPVVGLIYIPVMAECYYATVAMGAVKQDASGKIAALALNTTPSDATVILASRRINQDQAQAYFGQLGPLVFNYLSSAWKFAQLAEGAADIVPRFGETYEWDTAAGQCILEQVGGGIFDLQGKALRYNTQASFINPHFIAIRDKQRLYPRLPWRAVE